MDYARSALADRLAAAYVLGTLRGPARRRMEALLPAHPVLRAAVSQWEQRLAPLAEAVPPVPPSPRVWAGIERRLFGSPVGTPTAAPWWQRLAFWRLSSGLAAAAALALAVVLNQTPPAQPPMVVVLSANPEVATALQTSFVASLSADGRALVLKPLHPQALSPGRALQLWAVPATGAPRSLGLVQAEATTTLLRAPALGDAAALAVSVEPAGGSPTGAPTGPIVSVGKLGA